MKIKDLIPWARKDEAAESSRTDDHPISSLQREMNQVFDNFWGRFSRHFGDLDWHSGQGETKSDVVQTKDAVEISVELPGMDMKDIEVSVNADLLTVRGEKRVERQEEKQGYYLSERSYGAIYRAIPLPPGVDGDKAEATFRNGVLTIRLPQTPESRTRVKQIEIRTP
jgi:HSP20 family protein